MIATIKRLLGVRPAPNSPDSRSPANFLTTLTTDAQREYVAWSVFYHIRHPEDYELTPEEEHVRIDRLDGPWCAMTDGELRVAYSAIGAILGAIDPLPNPQENAK